MFGRVEVLRACLMKTRSTLVFVYSKAYRKKKRDHEDFNMSAAINGVPPTTSKNINRGDGGAADVASGSSLWNTSDILTADNTAAIRTFTIPTAKLAAVLGEFVQYSVVDEYGQANVNSLNIATQGAELIGGAASVSISVKGGGLTFYSDGTNWQIRR